MPMPVSVTSKCSAVARPKAWKRDTPSATAPGACAGGVGQELTRICSIAPCVARSTAGTVSAILLDSASDLTWPGRPPSPSAQS